MTKSASRTARANPAPRRLALAAAVLWLGLQAIPATASAQSCRLAIQPVLGEAQTRAAYRPLADYLSALTGSPCTVVTRPNFFSYWDFVRRGKDFEFVLDAAHFTDYRVAKLGFVVLAKVPDAVSYSLIVSDQNPIFDPSELVARRIATFGIPSIGAARLQAMFPNPVRQPVSVEVDSAEQGIKLLLSGKVAGAILPTPLVSLQMATGGGISVVVVTEPIPHIALSAAPTVDPETRERVRQALLTAHRSDDGKKMLEGIGFEKFDPATAAVYANQSGILKEYWGY
ncbi:MAG TPA: PhnD/SsuA/transferrin family substrate-binding protein [Acidiferrobacterales bacterium]|jgi:phosphonate transport system substrate-binding protein